MSQPEKPPAANVSKPNIPVLDLQKAMPPPSQIVQVNKRDYNANYFNDLSLDSSSISSNSSSEKEPK